MDHQGNRRSSRICKGRRLLSKASTTDRGSIAANAKEQVIEEAEKQAQRVGGVGNWGSNVEQACFTRSGSAHNGSTDLQERGSEHKDRLGEWRSHSSAFHSDSTRGSEYIYRFHCKYFSSYFHQFSLEMK